MLYPDGVEHVEVKLESFYRVVSRHVVDLELLDDHKDKQVEHDMCDRHYEADVVERGKRPATCLAPDAVGPRLHAVVHQLVPIFSSSDRK